MDGADVIVLESRGCLSFVDEALLRLWIVSQFRWKEFKCNGAFETGVFGAVNHSHASFTEFFQNLVVRYCLADHCAYFTSVSLQVNREIDPHGFECWRSGQRAWTKTTGEETRTLKGCDTRVNPKQTAHRIRHRTLSRKRDAHPGKPLPMMILLRTMNPLTCSTCDCRCVNGSVCEYRLPHHLVIGGMFGIGGSLGSSGLCSVASESRQDRKGENVGEAWRSRPATSARYRPPPPSTNDSAKIITYVVPQPDSGVGE